MVCKQQIKERQNRERREKEEENASIICYILEWSCNCLLLA